MDKEAERARILQLVNDIDANIFGDGTQEERDRLVNLFNEIVPNPHGSDLIFHPDLCGYDHELSPEEIADAALNYGPPS